jgi:hypothetical protein
MCHSERSKTTFAPSGRSFAKSKNLRHYQRSFDSVFLDEPWAMLVEKNSAQDDTDTYDEQ